METEYLDEEQVIALYNKVRTGKRTWPADIWSSPAALQYAVTIFDYWIHNVMGWKGWPDSRGKVTPALLEEHRLADLVESVFVPEFGDDWLDFEVVLNESMRLSEDEGWSPELSDRQARPSGRGVVDRQRRGRAPRRGDDGLGRAAPLLPGGARPRDRGGQLGAGDLPARAGDPGRGAGGRQLRGVAQGIRRRVLPVR